MFFNFLPRCVAVAVQICEEERKIGNIFILNLFSDDMTCDLSHGDLLYLLESFCSAVVVIILHSIINIILIIIVIIFITITNFFNIIFIDTYVLSLFSLFQSF